MEAEAASRSLTLLSQCPPLAEQPSTREAVSHGTQRKSQGGRGPCVHAAMGQAQNSILSRFERGFVPSVWQSMQPSCILNFGVCI